MIKYFNAAGNLISYSLGVMTRHPVIIGMPLAAGIELTNYCNLRCPECLSGSGMMTRQKGFMSKVLFEKVITELRPYLFNLNLYFQGESMMHPEFFDLLEITRGLKTLISTNGHFLTEENIHKLTDSSLSDLIVSLDGMNEQSYSLYRVNGDFNKVIKGIELLSEILRNRKSGPKLELQFLVNRFNEKEIPEAKRFAEKVHAKLRLKSMQVIDVKKAGEWLPENEKFRRYGLTETGFKIKSGLSKRCFRLWSNPVITWDGKVVPCCFDKNGDNVMGDLSKSTFREIWYSEKYKEFRRKLLANRDSIEICRNCTTGLHGVDI